MKANSPQLTIGNIPEPLRSYLDKKSKQAHKSLNQTVIDELSEQAGLTKHGKPQSILDSLDWFIGSGMDQATLDALDEMHADQKKLAGRELAKFQAEQAEYDS